MPPTCRTLDLAELEEVSGGDFKGLYGQVNAGATLGRFSANAGMGVSPGVLGEGALYNSSNFGVGRWGLGLNSGATVGAVFGDPNVGFDDVVRGGAQHVTFLVGRVSWNDNGFYVGIGPSGLGYARGETTKIEEGPNALQEPTLSREYTGNEPQPQLTDWSDSFGDREGSLETSQLARDAGIDDIGRIENMTPTTIEPESNYGADAMPIDPVEATPVEPEPVDPVPTETVSAIEEAPPQEEAPLE